MEAETPAVSEDTEATATTNISSPVPDWERTVMEWQWREDIVEIVKKAGIGQLLVDFLRRATISEDDPALVVLLNPHDLPSLRYFNGGNYHLFPFMPGVAAWPGGWNPDGVAGPPAGVYPPPNAVIRFFAARAGVGLPVPGQAIFTGTQEVFFDAAHEMKESMQFTRAGPVSLARCGTPMEPPLLDFVYITGVGQGGQSLWRGFNVA